MTSEPKRLQTNRTGIAYDKASLDRLSYSEFRKALGMSQELVDAIVKDESDCIVTELCEQNCRRGKSAIHGIGIFATRDINPHDIIAPGRRRGKRCIAGRWTNHSATPNAMFMAGTGDAEIELVATERIGSGDEITVDYGQAKELAYRLEESR